MKNNKVTDWLKRGNKDKVDEAGVDKSDEVMENSEMDWEDDENRELENQIRMKEKEENHDLIKEMVTKLICDTPEIAEERRKKTMLKKRERALDRMMIGRLVRELAENTPRNSEITGVLESVMETVMVNHYMNVLWDILENNQNLQNWIKMKMRSQELEKSRWEYERKKRLMKVKRIQAEESRMDWMTNESEEIAMEVEESMEHAFLEELMKDLDINLEEMELEKLVELGEFPEHEFEFDFNDDIEHNFLDEILQEYRDVEIAWNWSWRICQDLWMNAL